MALIPFLVVIAVDGVRTHVKSHKIAALVLAIAFLTLLHAGQKQARERLIHHGEKELELTSLRGVLDARAAGSADGDLTIMTRDPWEVYHVTRRKAIQTPNEGLDVIHEAAMRFEADYVVLSGRRSAFNEIYRGKVSDPRFEFSDDIPNSDWKLYRIIGD